METSAGIVLIYDKKILLVHPTKAKWLSTFSIPNGKINKNENIREAAYREFKEETGINIPRNLPIIAKDKLVYKTKPKTLYYFVIEIQSLSEIGLVDEKIPREQLSLEKIDFTSFLRNRDALNRIDPNQEEILKYLEL